MDAFSPGPITLEKKDNCHIAVDHALRGGFAVICVYLTQPSYDEEAYHEQALGQQCCRFAA